jgi:hypothetical protein
MISLPGCSDYPSVARTPAVTALYSYGTAGLLQNVTVPNPAGRAPLFTASVSLRDAQGRGMPASERGSEASAAPGEEPSEGASGEERGDASVRGSLAAGLYQRLRNAPERAVVRARNKRVPGGLFAHAPKGYTPSFYTGPYVWTQLVPTIAVDSKETAYLTDGVSIFHIVAGTPTMVIKAKDLPAPSVAFKSPVTITAVSVDEHGTLFFLRGDTDQGEILKWTGTGPAEIVRAIPASTGGPHLFQALGGDRFAVVGSEGLFESTPTALTLDYDATTLHLRYGCHLGNVAMTVDRYVFFVSNCLATPLLGGWADESGIGTSCTTI